MAKKQDESHRSYCTYPDTGLSYLQWTLPACEVDQSEALSADSRKANSEDPDQTAPKEQSDLGLHCLLICCRPNILARYSDVLKVNNFKTTRDRIKIEN